jgi:hypothetical protein
MSDGQFKKEEGSISRRPSAKGKQPIDLQDFDEDHKRLSISDPLKGRGTYVFYTILGGVSGLAASVLACGVCSATAVDTTRPHAGDIILGSFAVEVLAPFVGGFAGLLLAHLRVSRAPRHWGERQTGSDLDKNLP